MPLPKSASYFERLAMPHRNAAFNLAFWILRDRADAEDVVQEAYLRAFRAFPVFRGGDVKPWLLVIVRNVAFSTLEARKRGRNLVLLAADLSGSRDADAQESACAAPNPEALAIAESERQRLMGALAALPSIYRDVVVLREMEGLSYKDIAAVTGIPRGTVMSRLSRGRAELRKVLNRNATKV
jgi:RNA polymerase sigma-70 factor, ECF subfamily